MPSSSRTERRRKSRRDNCDERVEEDSIEVEYKSPQHHQLQRKHSNTQKESSWLDIDSELDTSSKHKNYDSREEKELVERAISQRRDSIRENSRDVDSQKLPRTSSSKLSRDQSSNSIDMIHRDRNHERRKARREKRSQKQFDSRDSNSLRYDSSNETDGKKYHSSYESKTGCSSDRKLGHTKKKDEERLQKQSNSRDSSRQRFDSGKNSHEKVKSENKLESNNNKLNTTKEKPPNQPKYEMKQDKRKKTYSSNKRERKEIDIPMEIECNNAYDEEQNQIIQQVQRKREFEKVEKKRKQQNSRNNKKKEVSDIENQNEQEQFDDNPLEENHSKRRYKNEQEFAQTSQRQRNQIPAEHCIKSQRLRKIVPPFMFLMLILCIAAWLGQYIPGLRDEVKKLEIQVGRLQEVNSNLESETDRLGVEIGQLRMTNDALTASSDELKEENSRLKDWAKNINATIEEYKEQNEILKTENGKFEEYTKTLDNTVDTLVEELAKSVEAEKQLRNTVQDYEELKQSLNAEILHLVNQTYDLNETVIELNHATALYEEQNQKLSSLNEDLNSVVGFLQAEVDGVHSSYEVLVGTLADTILRKEVLAEIALKERIKKDISGWECGFSAAFANEDFGKDGEVAIGYSSYDTVMNYINDRILSDVCVQRGNFELYLNSEILLPGQNKWEINRIDLVNGVNLYLTDVLNHYFPGETGSDKIDWSTADYDCRNLAYEDRFSFNVQ